MAAVFLSRQKLHAILPKRRDTKTLLCSEYSSVAGNAGNLALNLLLRHYYRTAHGGFLYCTAQQLLLPPTNSVLLHKCTTAVSVQKSFVLELQDGTVVKCCPVQLCYISVVDDSPVATLHSF